MVQKIVVPENPNTKWIREHKEQIVNYPSLQKTMPDLSEEKKVQTSQEYNPATKALETKVVKTPTDAQKISMQAQQLKALRISAGTYGKNINPYVEQKLLQQEQQRQVEQAYQQKLNIVNEFMKPESKAMYFTDKGVTIVQQKAIPASTTINTTANVNNFKNQLTKKNLLDIATGSSRYFKPPKDIAANTKTQSINVSNPYYNNVKSKSMSNNLSEVFIGSGKNVLSASNVIFTEGKRGYQEFNAEYKKPKEFNIWSTSDYYGAKASSPITERIGSSIFVGSVGLIGTRGKAGVTVENALSKKYPISPSYTIFTSVFFSPYLQTGVQAIQSSYNYAASQTKTLLTKPINNIPRITKTNLYPTSSGAGVYVTRYGAYSNVDVARVTASGTIFPAGSKGYVTGVSRGLTESSILSPFGFGGTMVQQKIPFSFMGVSKISPSLLVQGATMVKGTTYSQTPTGMKSMNYKAFIAPQTSPEYYAYQSVTQSGVRQRGFVFINQDEINKIGIVKDQPQQTNIQQLALSNFKEGNIAGGGVPMFKQVQLQIQIPKTSAGFYTGEAYSTALSSLPKSQLAPRPIVIPSFQLPQRARSFQVLTPQIMTTQKTFQLPAVTTSSLTGQRAFQTTVLSLGQISSTRFIQTPALTTPNISPPIVPPIITPTFFTPPPVPFGFPSLDLGEGRSTRKFRGKQRKRYTPSYEAFVFKIRGKKPKGVETTARLRPITKGFKLFDVRKL